MVGAEVTPYLIQCKRPAKIVTGAITEQDRNTNGVAVHQRLTVDNIDNLPLQRFGLSQGLQQSLGLLTEVTTEGAVENEIRGR